MNTSKKRYVSDGEGVVHVDVATGSPGKPIEVLVIWEEAAENEPASAAAGEDWTDLFGSLRDTPIERGSQGQYESRDALK